MPETAPLLIVMRLANMHRMHPRQDNSRVCGKCREPVGIYPSGQAALRHNPATEVLCEICYKPQSDHIPMLAPGAEQEPAESFDAKRH